MDDNNTSTVSYSAATSITAATTQSGKTYTSTTSDENAILVSLSSGTVNLVNPTVTKSGGPEMASDEYNFYGVNAAVLAMGGGTTSITGGTITSSGAGGNGIFSYGGNGGNNSASGDGTTVYVSGTTIQTSANGSGGIMTTGGGKTVAKNLTITTTGESSAPIRTDRGGGTVSVSGGTYTSSGLGSPAIYSTANITVEGASLTSKLSEGVCIEGQNSVVLNNCTLTASNTKTNGNAQFLDAVILYQSNSGDAASGTSTFSMTGGQLVNTSGHLFHVTNTPAVISLNGVTITNSSDDVLLSVCKDGWSGASNIATLNASGQTLDGDILVGDDSTLTLNLTGGSTFTGKIGGSITDASGTTISTTVGTVNVSLDSSSKWYLEGDTYITSFSGTAANVITGSYNLYVNNTVLDGTSETDGSSTETGVTIANTTGNTLLTGTAYDDSISNSGSNVTINGGTGDDRISLSSSTADNVIQYASGDGDDTIYGFGADDTISISGSAYSSTASGDDIILTVGDDSVFVKDSANLSALNIVGTLSGGTSSTGGGTSSTTAITLANATDDTLITGSKYDDSITNSGDYVTIDGAAGNDYIYNEGGTNVSINGGKGDDDIINSGSNVTLSGDDGADYISNEGGTNVSISGGKGDDYIINSGSNVTLSGDDGADYIYNKDGTNVSISAGSGDDNIINTSSDVSISAGYGDDNIINTGTSVTIDAGTGADKIGNTGNNVSISGGTGNDEITNTGTSVTIDAGAGDDFLSNNGANVTLNGDDGEDYIYSEGDNVSISAGAGADRVINTGDNVSIDGGKGNDTLSSNGNATITGGAGTDIFVYASGEMLITDYGTGADKISLLGAALEDAATSGDDLILSFGDGDSMTIANGVDKKISFLGDKTTTYRFTDHAILNSAQTSATLTSAATSFSAANLSKLVTIDASEVSAPVNVTGNDKSNKIFAGEFGSTLNGGAGRDTLTGGNGTDIFVHETTGGNDIIVNYAASDLLSIVGGELTDASVKSNGDVVLKIGDDRITVKGASDTEITISADGTTEFVSGGVIYNSAKTSATLGSATKTFNASDTNVTSITGNAKANQIYASDNGSTLYGGKGNDSLWGGDGTDTFLYTAATGNDTIGNYQSGELLEILDANGDETTFSKATFNGTKLTLNVTGGGKVIFGGVDSSTTFNINGTSYTVSGKTLATT